MIEEDITLHRINARADALPFEDQALNDLTVRMIVIMTMTVAAIMREFEEKTLRLIDAVVAH